MPARVFSKLFGFSFRLGDSQPEGISNWSWSPTAVCGRVRSQCRSLLALRLGVFYVLGFRLYLASSAYCFGIPDFVWRTLLAGDADVIGALLMAVLCPAGMSYRALYLYVFRSLSYYVCIFSCLQVRTSTTTLSS